MDGKISITKSQYLNRASAFFPAHYIRPHICGNRSKDFCKSPVMMIGLITLGKEE